MGQIASIINQGLILSLVVMGVFITSRIIKKDDLTTEGSFGLGGALSALMISQNYSPWLSLIASLVCGGLIGLCTGLLYARLKMNHLMAGLVTTTACFSLSLALASANKMVLQTHTVFSSIPLSETSSEMIIIALIALLSMALLRGLLRSQIGLLLRATGDNPHILVHFSKSKSRYYILGFTTANALTGLSGSLFVQWSGFFSITGSIGVLVTGLASLMIAELFSKHLGIGFFVAAIIYQSIFSVTLLVGISPMWNNLVKASIMVLLVAISGRLAKGKSYA